MKIFYGTSQHSIDVTNVCFTKLNKNNIIIIPSGDCKRASYFTDPLVGIEKKIIIDNKEYNQTVTLYIIDNKITTTNETKVSNKLNKLHSALKIKHGKFNTELPEQKMSVRFLTGNEKVLEIGGNIGRNSLVIASIVKDLVVLETDPIIATQLTENRELNHFSFPIENSALSNRRLIQKGWNTIPSDTLQKGYQWVNTITLEQLKKKYNIVFDTLVLDCEGAFYYILMDMPEILNGITLIIMENDYHDLSKKQYVDKILTRNHFSVIYTEGGGWGPCKNNFFEVWRKIQQKSLNPDLMRTK
jgi:FkbM family methyltransferase